jgi:hypothetical protein
MPKEDPKSELKRLRKERDRTWRDEIFGGLSLAERAECDRKSKRIQELEIELQARAVDKKSSEAATAAQRLQWNKRPETDTPQGEPHQPYRRREKGSASRSTGSSKQPGKTQRRREEKGGE